MSADADLNQPDVIMRLTGKAVPSCCTARRLQFQTTRPGRASPRRFLQSEARSGGYQGGYDQRRLILLRGRRPVMHQLSGI